MKKLQLPYHKKMKQTTLRGFAVKKKKIENANSNKPVTSKILQSLENNVNENLLLHNNVFAESFRVAEFKKDEVLVGCFSDLEQTNSIAKQQQSQCFIPQSDLTSNPGKPASFNKEEEHAFQEFASNITDNRSSFHSDNNSQTDILSYLNSENVDHNIDSDNSIRNNYDLTMKFVSDSQGNKLFDHFTQKVKPVVCRSNIDNDLFTNSEQAFYCNFEKELIDKSLLQSTQNF